MDNLIIRIDKDWRGELSLWIPGSSEGSSLVCDGKTDIKEICKEIEKLWKVGD